MTDETFEKAKDLVEHIGYDREVISMLDTMIEHFYDNDYCDIKVNYQPGPGGIGLAIRHRDLPELRDALIKARDRFKYELRKNKEEYQAL